MDDNIELRKDMRSGNDEMKKEMKQDMSNNNEDMKRFLGKLESKVDKNHADLRTEMKDGYVTLETRMNEKIDKDRRAFQHELDFLKEEIKSVKTGSACTVGSGASTRSGLGSGTFARRPPLASTSYEPTWVPRSIEVTGWNTDFTLRNVQGICE